MEITVSRTVIKTITHCYHICPYFGVDGNKVMMCDHSEAVDEGYIIYHPKCDNEFPQKCPLLSDNSYRD